MSLDLQTVSCLLFVPGHRPDRFEKARAANPLGVILDLEDAVPPTEKITARRAIGDYLATAGDGAPLLVRLNPASTRAGLDDLAAVADGALPAHGLVLAKVEDPRDIWLARSHAPSGTPILAAIETALGVRRAAEIALALRNGDALGFGGVDFAADIGSEVSWEALLAARSALVQAAACGRVATFDVPYLSISDAEGATAETRRVRALGFTGKLAIHPAQVEPIRAAFRPTAAEVEHAHKVLAAMDAAQGGAAQVDGKMIDLPVALAARRIVALAASD